MISCDRIDYNDLELGPTQPSIDTAQQMAQHPLFDLKVPVESRTLTPEEAVNVVKITDILYGHNTKSNTKEKEI